VREITAVNIHHELMSYLTGQNADLSDGHHINRTKTVSTNTTTTTHGHCWSAKTVKELLWMRLVGERTFLPSDLKYPLWIQWTYSIIVLFYIYRHIKTIKWWQVGPCEPEVNKPWTIRSHKFTTCSCSLESGLNWAIRVFSTANVTSKE